jgi:hypothetical protein
MLAAEYQMSTGAHKNFLVNLQNFCRSSNDTTVYTGEVRATSVQEQAFVVPRLAKKESRLLSIKQLVQGRLITVCALGRLVSLTQRQYPRF